MSGNGFPKVVTQGSFSWGETMLSTIVDDPDVFNKTASSQVVHEWGEVDPVEGHTMVHLLALGDFEKVGFNLNGDGFEEEINRAVHDTFVKNAKLYRNHDSDPARAEGFVAKSAHNDDMGRVELLIGASHDKCADWLGDMERGDPVAFSMGYNCLRDDCYICDNQASHPDQYCQHVSKTASAPYGMGRILSDGRKCGVLNKDGHFNDISKVGTGADMTAFDLRKVASSAEELGHVPSGAELGEMFIRKEAQPDWDKVRVGEALALHGERLRGIPRPQAPGMSDKIARALRSSRTVPGLYRDLATMGVVLPFREFFKAAGMDEDKVEAAARKLESHGGSLAWASGAGKLKEASMNATYDPGRGLGPALDDGDRAELHYKFSTDLAQTRALQSAQKVASAGPQPVDRRDMAPGEEALAMEHAAYLLSAARSICGDAASDRLADFAVSL